jgi:RNA polymerase sigma-70 factor (ECF subfamily)
VSSINTIANLVMVAGVTETASNRAPCADEGPEHGEVVEAARLGDQEAFGKLYAAYAPMVHGILLARVPWREVDDLVQDVFLAAFKRLRTLRKNSAFGAWLAMITRNRAVDYHRRARKSEEMPELQERSRSEAETDAEKILEVVTGLPEAYRETLVLRLVEGMSGPEIAERTGLTPASVRVNLHRGMKLLREALAVEEVS